MANPSETLTFNPPRVPPSSETAFGRPTGIDDLISTLKPEVQERLDVLTRVADLLGIDDLAFSSYASAITRLSAREQEGQRCLNRLTLVERELQNHLATIMHEERLIESWIVRLDEDLSTNESTSTIQNRREAMLKKAKEYRTLLDAISMDTPPITFEALTAQQTANEQKLQTIKEKRAQVKAFKGLPPVSLRGLLNSDAYLASILVIFSANGGLNSIQNLALARQQLKSARAGQMELIQLRERLLGQMAASVV
ncbi:hypothetical protein C8R45DRAFT_1091251 [Mycena sanguinolenta]|nr:hypothetical protein C8R45DRAFT_1091251 [Mycena sanguinolenta]